MFEYIANTLDGIENNITDHLPREVAIGLIRQLGLGDFGVVMFSMPDDRFPKMSTALPRMATEEVQRSWTGSSGMTLLAQTTEFVRSLADGVQRHSGKRLEECRVLDFGCGYGRIARLMYYFVNESNFFGVDPWDESIRICSESGLVENFYQSEYLPESLPVGEEKFDLIYAFSVFTHLSERATKVNLRAISEALDDNGVVAITIRPVEYWDTDRWAIENMLVETQKGKHRDRGFSFLPHNRAPVDGDVTYGDTSMTLAWIENEISWLRVVGVDRALSDPYQIYVYLKKSGAL